MVLTPPAELSLDARTLHDAERARADDIFVAHQQAIYRRTDRMFAWLMGFQWTAGIVFALVVAPRSWSGSVSQTHVHVWAAVLLGGGISVFPAAVAIWNPGRVSTRMIIATAQML